MLLAGLDNGVGATANQCDSDADATGKGDGLAEEETRGQGL